MNCTITFSILGNSFTITDVPSDYDLKDISVEQLFDLIKTLPSTPALTEVTKELVNLVHTISSKMGPIPVDLTKQTIFPEKTDIPFTVDFLQDPALVPNRTNRQILNVVEDSPFEGELKQFILKEIGDQSEEGRFISLLNAPIVSGTTSAKGFFDNKNNRIFLNLLDADLSTEWGLELLAHELVHYKINSSSIEPIILKAIQRNIDIVSKAVKDGKNKVPKVIQDIVKIINSKKGTVAADEFIAYVLSNRAFQTYVASVTSPEDYIFSEQLFNQGVISLSNSTFNSLLIKYADREVPQPKVEEVEAEEVDDEEEYIPFAESNVSLAPITGVLKGTDRESWHKVAVAIRDIYNKNKGQFVKLGEGKYNSYDLNYSDRVDITGDDISEKNRTTQVLKLKQNDLVLLPQTLRFKSTEGDWVDTAFDLSEEESKTSYRPVIDTFIDKQGVLRVRVPASDKTLATGKSSTYDIPASFILSYRTFQGMYHNIPNAAEIKAAQDDLLSLYSSDKDDEGEAILQEIERRSFSNPLEKIKLYKPANTTVAFVFSNYTPEGQVFDPSYIQKIYDGITEGDIVRVKWHGKEGSGFRSRVIRKLGNMLVVVTSKGKVKYVKPRDLVEIIYREDNHPELETLRNEHTNSSVLYQANDIDSESKAIPKVKFSNEFKKTHKLEYIETHSGISDYYALKGDPKSDTYQNALKNRRYLTNKLKQGDLIKVSWNINGRISSGWYPVIGSTKNTVYFYTKKNNVQHINITSDDSKKSRLLAVAYSNVKEAALYKDFRKLYDQAQEKFEAPEGISLKMSKMVKEKKITDIHQAYFIKEFKLDPKEGTINFTINQIKEAYAKVQPGDIVKVLRTKSNGETYFQWRVVTDFDEYNRAITVGVTNKYTKVFESGKTFTDEGGYRVFPINEGDVVGVGFNTRPNVELGIEGHPEIRLEHDEFVKELRSLSAPKFLSPTDNVSEGILKYYDRAPAFFGLKNGIEVWATQASYLDSQIETKEKKYWLREKGRPKNYLSEGKFKYQQVWYPKRIKRGYLVKVLSPGDILTEEYTRKDGTKGYSDSVVLDVYDSGITVLKSVYDEETRTASFVQKNIFKNFDESKTDYPTLKTIFLRKKGRGVDKAKEDMSYLVKNSTERSAETSNFTKSKDSREKIIALSEKLNALYGIPINVLSTSELEEMNNVVPTASQDRAFVHNGIIYINSDLASTAEPLHEMSHIVLSILQVSNPALFNNMMIKVQGHPDYDLIASNYQNLDKDRMDMEVFSTLFGEYYRNELARNPISKNWYDKNESLFTNIVNFVKGIFSAAFGNSSILNISDKDFMNMSLDKMFTMFGNDLINKKLDFVVNQYKDVIDQKIVDLKSKLLEESKLIMNCYK